MSERASDRAEDGPLDAQAGGSRPPTELSSGPSLTLAVVEYDDRADRGTVYPDGLAGLERMETWLSADLSSFEDLRAWR